MLMNLRPVDSRQRALSMFDMDGLDADASTEYISNAWANAGSSGIGRRNTHSEHLHLHLGAIAMWIPVLPGRTPQSSDAVIGCSHRMQSSDAIIASG
jgi:hypothetical protein